MRNHSTVEDDGGEESMFKQLRPVDTFSCFQSSRKTSLLKMHTGFFAVQNGVLPSQDDATALWKLTGDIQTSCSPLLEVPGVFSAMCLLHHGQKRLTAALCRD